MNVEIEWDGEWGHGGILTVDNDGLSGAAICCGCSIDPLSDREKLTALRDALTEYLATS